MHAVSVTCKLAMRNLLREYAFNFKDFTTYVVHFIFQWTTFELHLIVLEGMNGRVLAALFIECSSMSGIVGKSWT